MLVEHTNKRDTGRSALTRCGGGGGGGGGFYCISIFMRTDLRVFLFTRHTGDQNVPKWGRFSRFSMSKGSDFWLQSFCWLGFKSRRRQASRRNRPTVHLTVGPRALMMGTGYPLLPPKCSVYHVNTTATSKQMWCSHS